MVGVHCDSVVAWIGIRRLVGVFLCDSVARSAWVSSFVIWWVGACGSPVWFRVGVSLLFGKWGVRDGSGWL